MIWQTYVSRTEIN
uniref:Uncharacterized protein n=1 Tax=Rhizophora mucronata TaxID=61149 RepID=A0A2P2QBZ7_RHIMU